MLPSPSSTKCSFHKNNASVPKEVSYATSLTKPSWNPSKLKLPHSFDRWSSFSRHQSPYISDLNLSSPFCFADDPNSQSTPSSTMSLRETKYSSCHTFQILAISLDRHAFQTYQSFQPPKRSTTNYLVLSDMRF